MRRGIDGLAAVIRQQFKLSPFQKNVLFLFCGRKSDRIKGLVWEGDGFCLLYKRIEDGRLQWPRTEEEVLSISKEDYRLLMQGFQIIQKSTIRELPAVRSHDLLCKTEKLSRTFSPSRRCVHHGRPLINSMRNRWSCQVIPENMWRFLTRELIYRDISIHLLMRKRIRRRF